MHNLTRSRLVEILMVLLFVAVVGYLFVYPRARLTYLEYKAEALVPLIEQYKDAHGVYPESLSEAGINMPVWLSYEMSDNEYRLSFYAGKYWYMNTYTSRERDWYIQD